MSEIQQYVYAWFMDDMRKWLLINLVLACPLIWIFPARKFSEHFFWRKIWNVTSAKLGKFLWATDSNLFPQVFSVSNMCPHERYIVMWHFLVSTVSVKSWLRWRERELRAFVLCVSENIFLKQYSIRKSLYICHFVVLAINKCFLFAKLKRDSNISSDYCFWIKKTIRKHVSTFSSTAMVYSSSR